MASPDNKDNRDKEEKEEGIGRSGTALRLDHDETIIYDPDSPRKGDNKESEEDVRSPSSRSGKPRAPSRRSQWLLAKEEIEEQRIKQVCSELIIFLYFLL